MSEPKLFAYRYSGEASKLQPYLQMRPYLLGRKALDTTAQTSIGDFGFQDDTSFPTFYEVEKHRGTVLVGMNDRNMITVGDGQEGRIATYGLGGCTAVATIFESRGGRQAGAHPAL